VVGLTLLTAGAFAVNGTVVVVPPGVITATLFNSGVVCCPSGSGCYSWPAAKWRASTGGWVMNL